MTGNRKGSFSFFLMSFFFFFFTFEVKIIVRIEVARLQVWGNLFLSYAECLTIEYEEVSISCMIKMN